MHVVMEMNLKLHSVEYVVFDEADRWEIAFFMFFFVFYLLL